MYSTLSEKQKEIVFSKKKRLAVRACPGSGKTYSVAVKLIYEMMNWKLGHQGIATLSFTNVAWQEIENKIKKDLGFGQSVRYPHFLGSIDSFINRFIFLPFGYLVMDCGKRPVLVGEPHGTWHGKFFSEKFFDRITINIKDELDSYTYVPAVKWQENTHIKTAKERLIKLGFANQNDANYFAMKLMEKYPQVARAIAARFPVIMVDEAQDTSDIQMRIIDSLAKRGVRRVLLIGDPDQSIFEWHKAKPSLFIKKCKEWDTNLINLNENRRSSKRICEFTYNLSSLSNCSRAINNEVTDCDYSPEVWGYNDNNYQAIIDKFIALCESNGMTINKSIAVLSRSSGVIREICNLECNDSDNKIWPDNFFIKDLCKGKYLYDNNEFREGFRLVERGVYKMLKNSNYCSGEDLKQVISEYGFVVWRKKIHDLIIGLPTTDCVLVDWINGANAVLVDKEYFTDLVAVKNQKSNNIEISGLFAVDSIDSQNIPFRLGTVHSAKGETFEAVLIILKKKGVGKFYKTLIRDNVCIQDDEELRIVYVGITRPRKLLVLAVPQSDKEHWESKFS